MSTDFLITILEHPHIEKGYKEFKKYLKNRGKTEYVAALDHLLKVKFNNNASDNTDIDKK
ncbi:MAG: hypothetical protein DWQ19_11630 [Crenarchaeota archaeon]|nr:MAG: hypothetical protein DWQ19_11630 [Thermoproteota archaeon]